MSNQHKKDTVWHPFTQHAINPNSVHVERASGASLFTDDGREIIDAISSWWVITHGHCDPRITKAVQEQAANLEQVIFAGFTHSPAEELAAGLMRATKNNFDHVFYADSGSTAVEVALKMAIGYWIHTGAPRQKIIAFHDGYHGDTFGMMSTGGPSTYNKVYENFLFEVEHIPVPMAGCEAESFAAMEAILKANKDNVAAFVFEPLVQGAGGMNMYSTDALNTLCDMARKDGVLLIGDEVMTGFGRTGSMFAHQQCNFVPDILCLSKGLTAGFLPMGAALCTGAIYDAFYHKDRSRMFFHSSSFMGNPLACAAANASLKIWEDEPVMARINAIENAHESAAQDFKKRGDVENVRQKGTILAMDVAGDQGSGYLSQIQPKLYDLFLSQDVLLRPLGNTIYVLPPYCISEGELARIYDTIHFALNSICDE